MKTYLKIVDYINKIVGYILGVMIGTMSILILLQIFTRFIINYPLHWTEELARYLMIYGVFLGAALALRYNRLISIEAVAQALPPKMQILLKKVVMVITIIFALILVVQGTEITSTINSQTSAGLGISMSIPYLAIPLGAVLLIINALAVLIDGGKNHREESEEATWQ